MIRVVLTIVLPLLLPTALYLLWLVSVGRAELAGPASRRARLPWTWLIAAGVGLVALTLVVVSVGIGGRQEGTYVPPHTSGGQIVPGHIEPAPPARR